MALRTIPILKSCLSTLPAELTSEIIANDFHVCDEAPAGYYLSCANDALVLHTDQGETIQPLLSRPQRFSARQPLLRALAPARGGTIIDATAGLGEDSLKLAMVADRVYAIERNPVVFALLLSALLKAQSAGIPGAEKIEVRCGDAISLLAELPQADIIYMDPMFPAKRKRSALPPKSVRILRELVGDDIDDVKLLAAARRHAVKRVVVKRPLHAAPLAEDHVALHEGKVVRYEIYLPTRKEHE